MLEKLLQLLGLAKNSSQESDPGGSIDIEAIIEKIRTREQDELATGRKIVRFDYRSFEIILDREFTGRYRISVFQGQHKCYGFAIQKKELTDEEFKHIWERVIGFLGHSPSPARLPEHELWKAHFFGNPQ